MSTSTTPRREEMDDLGVAGQAGRRAEFVADPYPHYRRLRAGGEVQRAHPGGRLLVLGHREGARALREPRLRHPLESVTSKGRGFRQLVAPGFTADAVAQRRVRIDRMVAGLLGEVAAGEPFEVVGGLARPLTLAVISDLLGIPEADRAWLTSVPSILSGAVDPSRIGPADPDLLGYFQDLFESKRADPADDLISQMIASVGGDHRPWAEGLARGCHVLLTAGYEATAHAIGNMVFALARHPAQHEFLRAHPERIPVAADELLRYDPPVQIVGRTAAEDLEVEGEEVAAGETVLVVVGAANRDPRWLPDPDRLNVGRAESEVPAGPARHLAFGGGGHYCLGAALARTEAEAVLAALSGGPLELAVDPPEYRPGYPIRGLAELQVLLSFRFC